MRPRYLRPALTLPQIYLYRAPIDFRKQANGLAALVEQQLGHNPFSGALYAFTNRRRNKIKVSAPRSAPVFRTIRSSHLTSSFLHRGFSYDYATT